jgi:hypothetical protein
MRRIVAQELFQHESTSSSQGGRLGMDGAAEIDVPEHMPKNVFQSQLFALVSVV